jgi:hypothetical protein
MTDEPGPDAFEREFGEPLRGTSRTAFDFHSRDSADTHLDDGAGLSGADAEAGEPADPFDENASVLDTVTGAVAAPDPQTFLLGLVTALGRAGGAPAGNESSLGTMLRYLGHGLEEGLDENSVFQDLVAALERKRFRAAALDQAVPIIAAFIARIVSGPVLPTASGASPAQLGSLVRAAADIAREAIKSGGARSWRALPEIAATIARRAAQRGSSIGTLAEALPRLWARLAPGPRDASTSEPDHPRGRTRGEPRRMVLSGPVEIVILER